MCSRPGRAFALPELAAILAIALIAIALLAITADRHRRAAGLTQSQANLRQIGAWTDSFSADNQDRYWGYTWNRDQWGPSQHPDLQGPFADDLPAAAAQAVDLLRRRTGGDDLPPITNWIPHILYSHLLLADYAARPLPGFEFISPGDRNLMTWARDPEGFIDGHYPPQPLPSPTTYRWAYSSSYELPAAFFQTDGAPGEPAPALTQSGSHNTYLMMNNGTRLFPRARPDVRFPAQKAFFIESNQRYFGSQDLFYLFPEARVPQLMADGSAVVRPAREANPGWNPQSRTTLFSLSLSYAPAAWDPPSPNGGPANVTARHRWTRGGLKGRDFDGPEINTTDWR